MRDALSLFPDADLYKEMSAYVMSEFQLRSNGFPMSSLTPGSTNISIRQMYSKPISNTSKQVTKSDKKCLFSILKNHYALFSQPTGAI